MSAIDREALTRAIADWRGYAPDCDGGSRDSLRQLLTAAERLLNQRPATDEEVDRAIPPAWVLNAPVHAGRSEAWEEGYRAGVKTRDPFAEAGESKEE